jgi:hypothetical protein
LSPNIYNLRSHFLVAAPHSLAVGNECLRGLQNVGFQPPNYTVQQPQKRLQHNMFVGTTTNAAVINTGSRIEPRPYSEGERFTISLTFL